MTYVTSPSHRFLPASLRTHVTLPSRRIIPAILKTDVTSPSHRILPTILKTDVTLPSYRFLPASLETTLHQPGSHLALPIPYKSETEQVFVKAPVLAPKNQAKHEGLRSVF